MNNTPFGQTAGTSGGGLNGTTQSTAIFGGGAGAAVGQIGLQTSFSKSPRFVLIFKINSFCCALYEHDLLKTGMLSNWVEVTFATFTRLLQIYIITYTCLI